MAAIGKINGADIFVGDYLKIQYFDKDFSYGSEIAGNVTYYDFGYKIFDGLHYHRLDGFVWFTNTLMKGFKILQHKKRCVSTDVTKAATVRHPLK